MTLLKIIVEGIVFAVTELFVEEQIERNITNRSLRFGSDAFSFQHIEDRVVFKEFERKVDLKEVVATSGHPYDIFDLQLVQRIR